jgi:hypothetical protein
VLHTQLASLFSIGMMRKVPTLITLDATPMAAYGLARHEFHAQRNSRVLLDLVGEMVEARPVSRRAA